MVGRRPPRRPDAARPDANALFRPETMEGGEPFRREHDGLPAGAGKGHGGLPRQRRLLPRYDGETVVGVRGGPDAGGRQMHPLLA